MKRIVLTAGLAALAAGCAAQTRGWQETELPTHDWGRAYEAAKGVFEQRFEIARSSWTRGTIEAKPEVGEGEGEGTLADLRGAGGTWRRQASCELLRDGLTVLARVAVRLERKATDQVAVMRTGGDETAANEVPYSTPRGSRPAMSRGGGEVWMDVGYDAEMARRILAAIAEQVADAEAREGRTPMPDMGEAERMIEEAKKLDAAGP